MHDQEPQVSEIDLLQAIVTSQTQLSEKNNIIIEMLQTLLPKPTDESSEEPSLKEMIILVLEQQEMIIQVLSQPKTCDEQRSSTELNTDKTETKESSYDE